MRRVGRIILLALIFSTSFVFVCAQGTKVSDKEVICNSKENLSANNKKQARIIKDLVRKYPLRASYQLTWESLISSGVLIYFPERDRLVRQYIDDGQVIAQEVFIGRVKERLEQVADGKVKIFDLGNDGFIQEENVSYFVAKGFDK